MRIDQVEDALLSAGAAEDTELEVHYTDYIVVGKRGTKLAGGFNVYHPWGIPRFPQAQVRATCYTLEELIGYLTVHRDDEPVFFLDEDDVPDGGRDAIFQVGADEEVGPDATV